MPRPKSRPSKIDTNTVGGYIFIKASHTNNQKAFILKAIREILKTRQYLTRIEYLNALNAISKKHYKVKFSTIGTSMCKGHKALRYREVKEAHGDAQFYLHFNGEDLVETT